MGRSRCFIAACVAVVALVAAVVVLSGGDDDTSSSPSDDPGEQPTAGMVIIGMPDWLTADEGSSEIVAGQVLDWHVTDLLHTAYETGPSGSFTTPYVGEDVTSDCISLEPGCYSVEVCGECFMVIVNGTVERTVGWTYDTGSGNEDVAVTYSIAVCDMIRESFSNMDWNRGNCAGGFTGFSELPRMVVCDELTESLESSLSAEYIRIGGDPSDGQGYLDFIASFVQLCISYPSTVTVDGSRMGWDYGTYGMNEYWALPIETLWHQYGDCEDRSALLCALCKEAGFDVAMGGKSGHVFAGVALDGFEEVSKERLEALGVGYRSLVSHTAVGDDDGPVYYAVETIRGQSPVGYTTWTTFGSSTFWGETGFYRVD